jgi:hypothetical protein
MDSTLYKHLIAPINKGTKVFSGEKDKDNTSITHASFSQFVNYVH